MTGVVKYINPLVMERMLDRPIRKGEIVHHINGVRDDNRPENLFLCSDHRQHIEIEKSLLTCFRELLKAGQARFNWSTLKYEAILRTS